MVVVICSLYAVSIVLMFVALLRMFSVSTSVLLLLVSMSVSLVGMFMNEVLVVFILPSVITLLLVLALCLRAIVTTRPLIMYRVYGCGGVICESAGWAGIRNEDFTSYLVPVNPTENEMQALELPMDLVTYIGNRWCYDFISKDGELKGSGSQLSRWLRK